MSPNVQAKVCAHAEAFAQRVTTPAYAGGEREAEVTAIIINAGEERRRRIAIGATRTGRGA
jgi:hypothetical protein